MRIPLPTFSLITLAACATTNMERRVDALMKDYESDVPSAALLVLKEGQPIVRKAYGLANLEEKIAATPETNYRLASVSKQFTAAAVLLLAEDGKLALDESIARRLPSLPPAATNVTVRHLLTHTSGPRGFSGRSSGHFGRITKTSRLIVTRVAGSDRSASR